MSLNLCCHKELFINIENDLPKDITKSYVLNLFEKGIANNFFITFDSIITKSDVFLNILNLLNKLLNFILNACNYIFDIAFWFYLY